MTNLLTFDKDSIEQATRNKLAPILNDPDFNLDYINRRSILAGHLFTWITAVVAYHDSKHGK